MLAACLLSVFGVTWFNNAYSPLAKVKLFVCISEMISFRYGTRISVNLTQWVRRVTLIDSVCFMLSFETQFSCKPSPSSAEDGAWMQSSIIDRFKYSMCLSWHQLR